MKRALLVVARDPVHARTQCHARTFVQHMATAPTVRSPASFSFSTRHGNGCKTSHAVKPTTRVAASIRTH